MKRRKNGVQARGRACARARPSHAVGPTEWHCPDVRPCHYVGPTAWLGRARAQAQPRASREAARRRYADNIFEMGAPSSWNKCAASARCTVTALHRCACSCAPPCLTMPRLLTTVPFSIRKGSSNFVMLSILGTLLADEDLVLDDRLRRGLTAASAAGRRQRRRRMRAPHEV